MKSWSRIVLRTAAALLFIFLSGALFMLGASGPASRLRLDWSHMAHISAERVLSPADRTSPRATMESFMTHMNSGHQRLKKALELSAAAPGFLHHPPEALEEAGRALYNFERAMHCLDFSQIPQAVRLQEARESILLLKEILDRVGIPRFDLIPGAAEAGEQRLVRWTIPKTEIRLYRVSSGEDEGSWIVEPESVAELERSYRRVRHLPYLPGATENAYSEYVVTPGAFFPPKWAQHIPAWATPLVHEQALWQWIALVVSHLLFASFLVMTWSLCRRLSGSAGPFTGQVLKIIPPVTLALGTFFMGFLIEGVLNITGDLYLSLSHLYIGVQVMGWTWLSIRTAELVAEMIILSPGIEPGSVGASFIRTISRLAGVLTASGIIMFGASKLGFSLTSILTGFGVAGLAVSLAAQPTIENIIGGIILFTDRSVSVGEFCRFGDKAGTVLSIDLRTTKIEALDQTIISIPNSQLAKMQITNVTRRSRALMQKTINLRYETTRDQLRWILASIRDVLHAHPKIYADPAPFARFEGFETSSLDVLIFAYVKTKKWSELLAIQEDILFRVGGIVERSGSGFAFPSTTAYIAKDGGLDREKGAEAEKEVRQWREDGLFPFPDTPLERMAALSGSVEYPPRS
jgi:MscS family membrane protein